MSTPPPITPTGAANPYTTIATGIDSRTMIDSKVSTAAHKVPA